MPNKEWITVKRDLRQRGRVDEEDCNSVGEKSGRIKARPVGYSARLGTRALFSLLSTVSGTWRNTEYLSWSNDWKRRAQRVDVPIMYLITHLRWNLPELVHASFSTHGEVTGKSGLLLWTLTSLLVSVVKVSWKEFFDCLLLEITALGLICRRYRRAVG